ncbi:MAG: TonB-dependent receptor [Spirochaetota bacterium]
MYRVGLPILLILLAATALLAEDVEVTVVDRDLEIPLEGVTVRVGDGETGGVTGPEGSVTLDVSFPPSGFLVLELSLVGYEPQQQLLRDGEASVEAEMVIEGLLEAEELVVEESAPDRGESDPGVSVVADRALIKSTAMIGVIEDAISTVRMLPGVSYGGAFGAFLSVRGGEPGELTHVMDGFVIKYPYHWGGGFSIFNPHILESVELSAGIFPVRYGQATSGLMEVTTIRPNQGLRWEFAQSTSTLEGYVQIPFGSEERSGLLVGTRLTNYDLVFAMTGQFLEDQGITFSRVPYIYDGYLKWYHRPNERTEWFVNGFVGTDGIGVAALNTEQDPAKEIVDSFDFAWVNQDFFVSFGVKQLLTERLLLSMIGGYENWVAKVDAQITEQGTREYSSEFVDTFGHLPGVNQGGTFTVDADSHFVNTDTLHHYQGRGDLDFQLSDRTLLQGGAGAFVTANEYDTDGSIWGFTFDESGVPEYREQSYDTAAPSNQSLTSFCYFNLNRTVVPRRLTADFGVRVDHTYLWNEGNGINTYPVLGPRALLRYTPETSGAVEERTWSVGTGIFTKTPFESAYIDEEMNLGDYDVSPLKSVMGLLGHETTWENGLRFKIEGYYKFLYDRFYVNEKITSESESSMAYDIVIHNDGVGHVGGFDILLDRRSSRQWDGMLSYSFIVSRYLNPKEGSSPDDPSAPRGEWYYPPFHRFHTLNLLVNFKPTPWFTLTPRLSFATGLPLHTYGDRQMIAATIKNEDGSTSAAEMYTRQPMYDDDRRDGWVMPVDIRASFHWYGEESKLYKEFYLGVQDILSPIWAEYGPQQGEIETDRYTGEEQEAPSQEANFPIVSIGFRLSY